MDLGVLQITSSLSQGAMIYFLFGVTGEMIFWVSWLSCLFLKDAGLSYVLKESYMTPLSKFFAYVSMSASYCCTLWAASSTGSNFISIWFWLGWIRSHWLFKRKKDGVSLDLIEFLSAASKSISLLLSPYSHLTTLPDSTTTYLNVNLAVLI